MAPRVSASITDVISSSGPVVPIQVSDRLSSAEVCYCESMVQWSVSDFFIHFIVFEALADSRRRRSAPFKLIWTMLHKRRLLMKRRKKTR